MSKSYFLLKSEPKILSIDQQKSLGKKYSVWDGAKI